MRNQSNILLGVAIGLVMVGTAGVVGCSSTRRTAPKGLGAYVKAVQAYNTGDRDRAIANAIAATRANPDLIMARLMLGDLYREGGEYDKAVPHYEKLVKLDPYTWSNFYRLGVSYQFLDRLKEAMDSYHKALKLNPDDPNSTMNLGLVHLYMGNGDDAVKFCEHATLLDPRSAAAFSNLGVALDSRGEFARAEAAYRHSLDLDPANTTTLLNLGTNLIQQNKGNEAVQIMEIVVGKQDVPMHRKRYGDALAKAGRHNDAVVQYEAAIKLDPRYYPAMNEIGWSRITEYKNNLELDDAKRDQALTMWSQSLTINPNQPRIQAAKQEWASK
ncbi:MAG: tetratricopeptide repeat protein [Tepidisphaeraceae bacterium]